MTQRLFIPEGADDAFEKLLRLSVDKQKQLAALIEESEETQTGLEKASEIGEIIDVSTEDAWDILNITALIRNQKRELKLDKAKLIDEIKAFAGKRKKPLSLSEDEIRVFIETILEEKPSFLRRRKARELKRGLIRYASAFRSFCDYRPYFESKEKRDKIEGLIPIIIARIRCVNDLGEEEDLVFQMDESSFKDFMEFALDIEKKLNTMKKYKEMKLLSDEEGR